MLTWLNVRVLYAFYDIVFGFLIFMALDEGIITSIATLESSASVAGGRKNSAAKPLKHEHVRGASSNATTSTPWRLHSNACSQS